MLGTLIQRYDKKIISFQKRETSKNYRPSGAIFMFVVIPYINLLILSWIKKISIFEEYGALLEGFVNVIITNVVVLLRVGIKRVVCKILFKPKK